MSAAILQEPRKVHDICDDRESAFHVLTWTALCFGNHNKTQPDRLRQYLKQYDYYYSAGQFTKGGELKIHALLQAVLANEVTFNPPLDRLIKDLTDHLRVRYFQIEPSDLETLEDAEKWITQLEQGSGDTKLQLEMFRRMRASNPAYKFTKNLERLERRNWLVETLRTHLAQSDWPLNDGARLTGLHLICNSKKRPAEDDPSAASPSKVARRAALLDVSSSRIPFASDNSGLEPVMETGTPGGRDGEDEAGARR